MASNSSGPIAPGNSYTLGNYTFTLQNVVSEDERIIQAHISGPEGAAAKGITVQTSTQLESWSVEATETEATVYCTIKKHDGEEGEATDELFPGTTVHISGNASYSSGEHMLSASGATFFDGGRIVACSKSPVTYTLQYWGYPGPAIHTSQRSTGTSHKVVGGKDVYYDYIDAAYDKVYMPGLFSGIVRSTEEFAYIALYGNIVSEEEGEITEVMVARFAIDLREADPGGDWDDPGDTGEPSTTLHLDITGALSGRHNDPLNDTSYSYLPTDKNTVKFYGCGGDGGHGGGGGGGAATIIVNRFGTDKASSKEIRAMAKRHGYGSGGGKGGKGGDGVILIYW